MANPQPNRRRRSIWVPILWALILGMALYIVFTGNARNPADSASPAPAATPPLAQAQGVTPREGDIPARPQLTAEVVRITVKDAARHEVAVDFAPKDVQTVDHPPLYACAFIGEGGLHEPEGGLGLPARMTLNGYWDLVEFIPGERETWRVAPLDKTLTSIGAYFRAHGKLPADAFGLMEKEGITSLDIFNALDAPSQRTMLLPYLNFVEKRIVRINPKSPAVPGDLYLKPVAAPLDNPALNDFLRANTHLDRSHAFALTLYSESGLLLEGLFFPLK
jgi:hypothetical protein